jgi:hypothetical protein
MLPIHNTTFDLSYHVWNEPLLRAEHEAVRLGVEFLCPKIGEKVLISELNVNGQDRWWDENEKAHKL